MKQYTYQEFLSNAMICRSAYDMELRKKNDLIYGIVNVLINNHPADVVGSYDVLHTIAKYYSAHYIAEYYDKLRRNIGADIVAEIFLREAALEKSQDPGDRYLFESELCVLRYALSQLLEYDF